MRTAVLAACIGAAGAGLMWATAASAQGQTRPQAPVHATMNQIMRGIFFTHSNVVFAVQTQDPASISPDREGSRSTNPLTGLFGNWEAVENSSLVLAEAATLLNMPGRLCGNGRQVPVSDEEWAKFAEELRHAAMNAYEVARTRRQSAMSEATEQLSTACSNCHGVYRRNASPRGGSAGRCQK